MSSDATVLRVSSDVETPRVAGPWYLDSHGYARLHSKTAPDEISATRPERVGSCAPGDVVLARLPDFDPTWTYDPNAWWLCEVCEVEGSDVS